MPDFDFITAENKPNCRAYRNAAWVHNNSANFLTIPFDAENFDANNMHDNVLNNSRITIPAGMGGKYIITGQITFAAADWYRRLKIVLNGVTDLKTNYVNARNCAANISVAVTSIEELAAGDFVELQAYQDSGGNLNAVVGRDATTFEATKITD